MHRAQTLEQPVGVIGKALIDHELRSGKLKPPGAR
jgi:hypothetical protein